MGSDRYWTKHELSASVRRRFASQKLGVLKKLKKLLMARQRHGQTQKIILDLFLKQLPLDFIRTGEFGIRGRNVHRDH